MGVLSEYAQPIRQAGELQSFAIAVRFNWPYALGGLEALNDVEDRSFDMLGEDS